MTQKLAGHLRNEKLVNWPSCVVLTGILHTDHKGRFPANSPVRTSWIEEVRYDPDANISLVYTRNSLYTCDGNILENISDDLIMSGYELKYHMDILEAKAKAEAGETLDEVR